MLPTRPRQQVKTGNVDVFYLNKRCSSSGSNAEAVPPRVAIPKKKKNVRLGLTDFMTKTTRNKESEERRRQAMPRRNQPEDNPAERGAGDPGQLPHGGPRKRTPLRTRCPGRRAQADPRRRPWSQFIITSNVGPRPNFINKCTM